MLSVEVEIIDEYGGNYYMDYISVNVWSIYVWCMEARKMEGERELINSLNPN